jgi:hypothetical protein
MLSLHRAFRCLTLTPLVLVAANCGSDESGPTTEDHKPVSYMVSVNDIQVTPPLVLTQGETVRVRLKFVNAAAEDLDDAESDHFAGLTFDPASLATATRVTDHHYQFDVTGGSPGSGTVQVSFGHDQLADETTFAPVDVLVDPNGGPPAEP